MKSILIFCLLTLFHHNCDAQNLECIYKLNQEHPIYYSCYLKTENASFLDSFPSIDGQHMTGNTDADVKELDLFENQKMNSLVSIFCKKFTNLKSVQLKNAELESVEEDSLLSCKNLNALNLASNKLYELPDYLLVRNPGLDRFDCSDNELTTLQENFFLSQGKLRILALNRNQIIFLPSNIFNPLVNLKTLDLSDNKLQSLDPSWFSGLINLIYLNLWKNEITEIPPKSFEALKYVTNALLYQNKIRTLHEDSFVGLENANELQLQENEISELPANVFSPMRSLEKLFLFKNKLEIIHSDSFAGLNYLTKIRFDNNKIDAMDPKLFERTPFNVIDMTDNICHKTNVSMRDGFKTTLKKCIDNYSIRNSCGKHVQAKGAIIGGASTQRGDFPWFAALLTPKGQFFCGGSLITNRKVVSAAHCIQDKKTTTQLFARDVVILLGAYDLNNHFEPGRGIHPVQTIDMHPDWNPLAEAYDADIVVLVLESEVAFTPNIQPICMVNRISNTAATMKGFVAGYGKSEDVSKDHENTPRVLEMPIHKNDACFLKNNVLATLSSERTFCAGSGNGRGVCSGDSGSGLIVSDGYTYYLRGIVSSALFNVQRSCDVNTYSVFTDITSYIDWINRIPTKKFRG